MFTRNFIRLNDEEFNDIKTGCLNYLAGNEFFWCKFKSVNANDLLEIVDKIKKSKLTKSGKIIIRNNVIIINGGLSKISK